MSFEVVSVLRALAEAAREKGESDEATADEGGGGGFGDLRGRLLAGRRGEEELLAPVIDEGHGDLEVDGVIWLIAIQAEALQEVVRPAVAVAAARSGGTGVGDAGESSATRLPLTYMPKKPSV